MAMNLGIGEILIILLLGGFLPHDLEPLPTDQVMMNLPQQCEVMAFMDFRGVNSAIDDTLRELNSQTWITSNPLFSEGISELTGMIERARSSSTDTLGFNPFTQLTSVGGCLNIGTSTERGPTPEFLVVVQGTFDTTLASTLAGLTGFHPIHLTTGQTIYGAEEDGITIGLASVGPGLMLFGTKNLLEPRLSGTLPAPPAATAPGALYARLNDLLPQGVYSFIAFQPSPTIRSLIGMELPVSLAQLLHGTQRFIALNSRTGSYFEVQATDSTSHRDFELIMEAAKEYLLAFNHTARALLWGAAGVLSPDDSELDPTLRQLVSQREAILTYLNENLLAGDPQVLYTSNPETLTTSLSMNNTALLQVTAGMGFFVGLVTYHRAPTHPEPYDYGIYGEPAVSNVCSDGTICPSGYFCDPCAHPSCPSCRDCVEACVPIP